MKCFKSTRLLSILVIAAMMLSMAGCSTSKEKAESDSNTGTSVSETAQSTETAADTETTEKIDPLGKYESPIEVTTVCIRSQSTKYPPGDSTENNVWTRAYENELGIKLKYQWIVDKDQREQKMNVSIASGELADIMPVNAKQFNMLVDSGLAMDLTDLFEQYASPLVKEYAMQDGGVTLSAGKINGRLMALINGVAAMDNAPLLWIRTDWLKKLGLSEPKTMDDVFKVSEAFTKQDPDKNGQDDTFGLAVNKYFTYKDGSPQGWASLLGFFGGYHSYPCAWVKDGSGNLVYGSIQPETRAALLKLQEMYKQGQIDNEFGAKDASKVAETAGAGKVGMQFGQMWNPLWPLQSNKDNDKDAQWQAYPVVSVDDKTAKPLINVFVDEYYVVNKNAKHPEAAIKLANFFAEKGWGKTAAPQEFFNGKVGEDTIELHLFAAVKAWPLRKNLDKHLAVMDAMKIKDTSKLNIDQKQTYDAIEAYLAGDVKQWGMERVFGETGAFSIINQYVNNDMFQWDEFFGAPTPTMAEKQSTLKKMEDEVFTRIIMGASIEEFDKFVTDWKKLGGDSITDEVNEWYVKRK